MSEADKKEPSYMALDTPPSSSQSWADETEPDPPEIHAPPAKSAWGAVAHVAAINIAEEQHKAKVDNKKNKQQGGRGRGDGRGERNQPQQSQQSDWNSGGGDQYQRKEYDGGYRKDRGDYDSSYGRKERSDYDGPRKERSDYDNYQRRSDFERPVRPPKEQQPVPTSPPYTAFIGNLAFSVTEEDLEDYYGSLGIVEGGVRIVRERDGSDKSKGYGYVEFNSAEGLKNALTSDNEELKGRRLNVDVENKTRKDNKRSQWGTGGSSSRGGRFEGGGGGRYGGGRSSYGERPKINIAPRSTEGPNVAAKSDDSRRSEDPFGGQDPAKLEEARKRREQGEKEREKKKQEETKQREEKERRYKEDREEREAREESQAKSGRGSRAPTNQPEDPREKEIDSKSSWRSTGSKPTRGRGGRNTNDRFEEGGRGRGGRHSEDRGGRGGRGGDYYTGAGRGEKPKAANRTEREVTQEKPKLQQQQQQAATTNPFSALAPDNDDDDDEEENNQ